MLLRLIAWNCRSGAVSTRVGELAPHSPDLVFLQECHPAKALLEPPAQVCARKTKRSKGIALASLNPAFHMIALERRRGEGRAVVAAAVTGPVTFTAIGVWSQPRYVADVLRTVKVYARMARAGPVVLMGDLNSGTDMHTRKPVSRGHQRIVDALGDLGLVSAYHAFHRVAHGEETHATYHHLFKPTQPWHIDFCFVPLTWASRIVSVDVLGDAEWDRRSDHRPVVVEIELSSLGPT